MSKNNPHIKEYPDLSILRYTLDLMIEPDLSDSFERRSKVEASHSQHQGGILRQLFNRADPQLEYHWRVSGYDHGWKIYAMFVPDKRREVIPEPTEIAVSYMADDALLPLAGPPFPSE